MPEESSLEQATPEPQDSGRSWLTDGLIVAALSAIAYLAAFEYERGYCDHFLIPRALIVVTLERVLMVGVIAVAVLYFAYIDVAAASSHMSALNNLLVARLGRFALSMAPLAMLTYAYRDSRVTWLLSSIGFGAFVYLFLIRPIHTQGGNRSYLRRLTADEEQLQTRATGLHVPAQWLTCAQWLIIAWVVIYCAKLLGTAHARGQEEFLVVRGNPEQVVLRVYGNTMVCAVLDRGNKIVRKDFSIRKLDAEPSPVLELDGVGPLRVGLATQSQIDQAAANVDAAMAVLRELTGLKRQYYELGVDCLAVVPTEVEAAMATLSTFRAKNGRSFARKFVELREKHTAGLAEERARSQLLEFFSTRKRIIVGFSIPPETVGARIPASQLDFLAEVLEPIEAATNPSYDHDLFRYFSEVRKSMKGS